MSQRTTTIDRRRIVKLTAAAAGLSATGLGALALAPQPARAAVTTDLNIPATSIAEEDGHAIPWLQVTGSYSYSKLDIEPTDWRVRVLVGQNGTNFDPLAQTTGVPWGFDGNGQYAVQAPLTDAAAYTSDDFQAPGDGQSVEVPVHARVVFEVLDQDAVLVSAAATDSGTVTVADSTPPYEAGVSGSGSWAWQANETSATPTPI